MRKSRRTAHGGFTLIEMIVVVLIILILVALVAGGILKFMDVGPQLQTTNDISQLVQACEAFKVKYKVYPPSKFLLSTNPADYSGNAYGAYLFAIWPRINVATVTWGAANGTILEGDQCLVFFLQGPNGQGFSANPTNPMQALQNQGETRGGPFYTFLPSRLVAIPHPQSTGGANANTAFPSFKDPYGLPQQFNVYAYFCAGRNPNGYSTPGTPGSDCPSLGAPLVGTAPNFTFATVNPATGLAWNPTPYVNPYIVQNVVQGGNTLNIYYNANSIQILSAGKDFTFGTVATAATATQNRPWAAGGPASSPTLTTPLGYPDGNYGFDDFSNFASGLLGVP